MTRGIAPGLRNDPWNKRRTWLICLGLALLILAAYGQLWDCEFVAFDDGSYVTVNDVVGRGLTGGESSGPFPLSKAATGTR